MFELTGSILKTGNQSSRHTDAVDLAPVVVGSSLSLQGAKENVKNALPLPKDKYAKYQEIPVPSPAADNAAADMGRSNCYIKATELNGEASHCFSEIITSDACSATGTLHAVWIQRSTLHGSESSDDSNRIRANSSSARKESDAETEIGGYLIREEEMYYKGYEETKEIIHWETVYKSLYDANVDARNMLLERMALLGWIDEDEDENPVFDEKNRASRTELYSGMSELDSTTWDEPMEVTVSVIRKSPLQSIVQSSRQTDNKSAKRKRHAYL